MRNLALQTGLGLILFVSYSEAAGSHGGQVMESHGHRIEFKLDRNRNQVDVYLIPASDGEHPDAIGLTFFDDQDRPKRTIELRAMAPAGHATGLHFQGSLDPSVSSSIGVEIKIPFSAGAPLLFRSKNLN